MFRSEKAVSTYFERVNWRMKKKKERILCSGKTANAYMHNGVLNFLCQFFVLKD